MFFMPFPSFTERPGLETLFFLDRWFSNFGPAMEFMVGWGGQLLPKIVITGQSRPPELLYSVALIRWPGSKAWKLKISSSSLGVSHAGYPGTTWQESALTLRAH